MPKRKHPSNEKDTETKTPAEFFAENQQIAGFDNDGKSMYTTLRELIENALDASESISQLPQIQISIQEIEASSLSLLHGLEPHLHTRKNQKKKRKKNIVSRKVKTLGANLYKITVCDNGCGMQHEKIPNLLGRVLSGSKYGVRQTRGKFGLGAKMALIWSMKSTGLPITVFSAQCKGEKNNTPDFVSFVKLEIDLQKNCPIIHNHDKFNNVPSKPIFLNGRGTEITMIIRGNWRTYQGRIKSYLQQLAVITPYADISLRYISNKKSSGGIKNLQPPYNSFTVNIQTMPLPPRDSLPHPSAIDNISLKHLLRECSSSMTLETIFSTKLCCISKQLANRITNELGERFINMKKCNEMSSADIQYIVQLLHAARSIPQPNPDCLSPANAYNLRLGIMYVLFFF
eukprot:GSMAST32.ASY1.ANO1.1491.1 assembled CDS